MVQSQFLMLLSQHRLHVWQWNHHWFLTTQPPQFCSTFAKIGRFFQFHERTPTWSAACGGASSATPWRGTPAIWSPSPPSVATQRLSRRAVLWWSRHGCTRGSPMPPGSWRHGGIMWFGVVSYVVGMVSLVWKYYIYIWSVFMVGYLLFCGY